MADFDTVECATCGEPFKASPDANAAQTEARSPACEPAS